MAKSLTTKTVTHTSRKFGDAKMTTAMLDRLTHLTSDRPIIMTNGIIGKDDHLALPPGPRMLFVATNNIETENMIRTINPEILMAQINDRVASQDVSTSTEPTTSRSDLSRTGSEESGRQRRFFTSSSGWLPTKRFANLAGRTTA